MSEADPYKHIRALARSITHMQKQIEERDGDSLKVPRHQRKNHTEIGAMATILRTARARKGLTQRELGHLAGVPQSHISKIEAGGVDLRLSSLLALAEVLDLTFSLAPATVTRPSRPGADLSRDSDPVVALRTTAFATHRHGQPADDVPTAAGGIAQ